MDIASLATNKLFPEWCLYAFCMSEECKFAHLIPNQTNDELMGIEPPIAGGILREVSDICTTVINIDSYLRTNYWRDDELCRVFFRTIASQLIVSSRNRVSSVFGPEQQVLYEFKPLENMDLSFLFLRFAATSGSHKAAALLAYFYLYGWGCCEINTALALRILLAVAKAGSAETQYTLGYLHHFGIHGVREHHHVAKYWYNTSAANGWSEAQNLIDEFDKIYSERGKLSEFHRHLAKPEHRFQHSTLRVSMEQAEALELQTGGKTPAKQKIFNPAIYRCD